jgi:hypothetical protein
MVNNITTMTQDLQNLRYPIGLFQFQANADPAQIDAWINSIANFPNVMRGLTEALTSEQKNLTYRPDGWSVKQVVHHCADSHINAFIRFKLTLTEDSPTIRPYMEGRWAELSDGKEDDLSDSLNLLSALHSKWSRVLRNLNENDFQRTYVHPQYQKEFTLLEAIALYAWHGEHHLAHVKLALQNVE